MSEKEEKPKTDIVMIDSKEEYIAWCEALRKTNFDVITGSCEIFCDE